MFSGRKGNFTGGDQQVAAILSLSKGSEGCRQGEDLLAGEALSGQQVRAVLAHADAVAISRYGKDKPFSVEGDLEIRASKAKGGADKAS